MLNLILTVILEAGASAAAEDEHENAIQLRKKVIRAEKKLIYLCESLDEDKSGALNIEEFMRGFANNREFQDALQIMNVNEADIQMIFNICDEDGSGDVNYREFVEQLRRIKDSGEKMLLYYVTDIRHMVNGLHRALSVPPTRITEVMKKTKEPVSPKEGKAPESQQAKDTSLDSQEPVVSEVKVDSKSSLPVIAEESPEIKAGAYMSPTDSLGPRFEPSGIDDLCSVINEMRQQLMVILQPIPMKVDAIANTQLEQISKINEDLAAILQQSKVQEGLLNKISGETTRIPPSSRGCLVMPAFPFKRDDAVGTAGNDGAIPGSNSEGVTTGCCVRVV